MANETRANRSNKRKQPDEDEKLLRDEAFAEQAIENEYENLDEGDNDNDDDDDAEETKLQEATYNEIITSQEPATINQYDDIQVTPFNLEQELEDGDFDKAGNFVFRKETLDENNDDKWAESVDWESVQKREEEQKLKGETSNPNNVNVPNKEPTLVRDKISCYKEMLRLMGPDETVKKTIIRLGKSLPKKQPKKLKLKTDSPATQTDSAEISEIRRKLESMIELAHQQLQEGDMDIYQKSYEDLEDAIN